MDKLLTMNSNYIFDEDIGYIDIDSDNDDYDDDTLNKLKEAYEQAEYRQNHHYN